MIFSLVIPCFNEGNNIPLLLERLKVIFKDTQHEIILVNNGSKDNTQEIIEKSTKGLENFKVIQISENIGYGNGIIKGLEISKGNILGWTHADLQTDPEDALKALSFFDTQNNRIFIKGLRKGRSIFDKFFTFNMSIFELFLLGKYMSDINAQPSIFNRELFDSWKNPPNDFSLDLFAYYTAIKANYKIYRFPVHFPKRIYGTSKWNFSLESKINFIKRTINFSLQLKKKLKNDFYKG